MATSARTLPGAAPTTRRALLTGSPVAGRVVARFGTCAYADLGGALVAVEIAGGVRLPCSVLLGPPDHSGDVLAGVQPGAEAVAGDGSLRLGSLTVRVVRWWRPAPPRGARPPAYDTADHLPGRWDELARPLLGLGPGLTPAGDDLLAGLLVGLAGRPDLRDPLAAAVSRLAPGRTTWLSAQLLRLAADGLAAPAVVAVADALAGRGPDDALATALPALLAVGHTSGAALARGLLLAAETLARDSRHLTPAPHHLTTWSAA
jgi:hypothetical protein